LKSKGIPEAQAQTTASRRRDEDRARSSNFGLDPNSDTGRRASEPTDILPAWPVSNPSQPPIENPGISRRAEPWEVPQIALSDYIDSPSLLR
jgi:hypothetical protein